MTANRIYGLICSPIDRSGTMACMSWYGLIGKIVLAIAPATTPARIVVIAVFGASKRSIDSITSVAAARGAAKAIQQIIDRSEGVRQLIADNPELVRADVEQALIRAATGYTVTERRERIVGGRKTVEIITRDIPPNQSAVEFFLTNKACDTYSKAPVAISEDGAGKLDAILEAMKNVK